MLSDEKAKEIWKRAYNKAVKIGFSNDAEDIAQDVCLNIGAHQTVDQAVIDYVRYHYGRPGKPGYDRKHALATAHSIFDENGTATDFVSPRGTLEFSGDFGRMVGWLKKDRDKEIIVRIFKYGETQREVAKRFNVTETRISQILGGIMQEMKTKQILETLNINAPKLYAANKAGKVKPVKYGVWDLEAVKAALDTGSEKSAPKTVRAKKQPEPKCDTLMELADHAARLGEHKIEAYILRCLLSRQ